MQLPYSAQTLTVEGGGVEHRTQHRRERQRSAAEVAGIGVGGALLVVLRSPQAGTSHGSSRK